MVGVAYHIEKLQRGFLWSRVGDELKFHLVNWAKICTSLSLGNLGIRNMFNRALLGKWLWRYNTESEALWKSVVEAKFGNMWGEWCSNEVFGPYKVGVWKNIKRGWRDFSRFVGG